MDQQAEDRRPYASSGSVIDVLKRVRSVNVPEKIDDHFLVLASVSKSGHRLVRQALQFLDLVDEDSNVTPRLKALASAPSGDYKKLLEDAIRTAYKADLDLIDPLKDSSETILDHFRRYEPRSTNEKMRSLFIGLCREADIPVSEELKQVRNSSRTSPARTRKPKTESKERPKAATAEQVAPAPAPTQAQSSVVESANISVPITPEDVSSVSDLEEFNVIWNALGRLVWNRHRSAQDDDEPLKQITAGQPDGVS